MSTYKKNLAAISFGTTMAQVQEASNRREESRKAVLSPEECYEQGRIRGIEDREDDYKGAWNRFSTLGGDYPFPEQYRNGYKAGYYPEA